MIAGFCIEIFAEIDFSDNAESECLYRSQSWTGTSKNGRKCLYGSRKWTCTSTQGENRPWHCTNLESKHLERSEGGISRPAGPGICRRGRQIRKGFKAAGGGGGILFPRMKRDDQRSPLYGVVNLYLTFLEDMERMYLIGIQATST